MPNITLSIPKEVHDVMKIHKHIRWSEIARAAIILQLRKIALAESIASKSKLTMKDVHEINAKIKKGMHHELYNEDSN